MRQDTIVLAIESAVGGGSIALLSGTELLGSTSGETQTSRAENLLVNISRLLDESGVRKNEIGRIAVSNGPGSFTGIRIGLATTKGLADGLGVPCDGISSLCAIAFAEPDIKKKISAVPVGRGNVCWQSFDDISEISSPSQGDFHEFQVFAEKNADRKVLVPPDLFAQMMAVSGFDRMQGLIVEKTLAELIGRAILTSAIEFDTNPIYVQNPRFHVGFS